MRHPGRALLALPDAPLSRRLPSLLSLLLLLLSQTRRHALRVQRCVHFLCLALSYHYYHPAIGHAYCACALELPFVAGRVLGINRLFFTHARHAISLQPPLGLLARDSRITCSNVSPSISVLFGVATTRTLQLFARAQLRLTSVD